MGRRAWLFALAFAVAKGAPAIEPETGLWWRAASPEWMLFLDRSGRDVVAVVIDRDAAGAPRWRLASGALSGAGFSAPLLAFRNGSCLTCPHRPPEVLATGLVLSFEAVSPVRGFLRIGDGPVEQVERLAFAGSHRGPRLLAGRGLDPALLPDPAGAWVVAGLEWRFGLPRWYGDLVLFAAPAVAEDGFGAEGEGRIDRPRWSFAGPDPDPPKPYRYRFGCRAQSGGALCDLVRWSEETPAETVFRWLSPLDFGTQAARLPLAALPPGVALHRLPSRLLAPEPGLWLDPARPGSGWLIDRGGDWLRVIELGYDAAGRPAWWVACGRIDATLRFRAPRGEALPGADPACATVKEAGSAGELVLDFRGSRAARLAPGVLERGLERFAFGQAYCGLSLPHGGRLLPVPELSGRHLLLLAEEGPEGLRLNDWPRVVRLERSGAGEGVAPCEWRVLREDGPAGAQPPGVLRCPGAPGEDSCRLVLPATPPWGSFAGVLDPVPTVEARLLPVDLGPGGAVSRERGLLLLRLPP